MLPSSSTPANTSSESGLDQITNMATQGLKTSAFIVTLFTADPISFGFGALGDLLTYVKYMNVTFSPTLQGLLNQPPQNGMPGLIFSDPGGLIANSMPNYSLPGTFQNQYLYAAFIANFASSLLTFVCLLLITGMVFAFLGVFKKKSVIYSRLKAILNLLMWNFFIMFLIGELPSVVLYTSIDLRTTDFSSDTKATSFTICLLINFTLIYVFVKALLTLKKYRKLIIRIEKLSNNKKITEHAEFKEKNKSYLVFFDFFKTTSFLKQAYIPIFILRLFLFALVISYLFANPVTQSVLLFVVNIAMMTYICLVKPFKENSDLIINIIRESLMLLESICLLILTIMEQQDPLNTTMRDNLSVAILISILGFLISRNDHYAGTRYQAYQKCL